MGWQQADHPYDALETLPRELWLGALITASGTAPRRLLDLPRWVAALHAGELPPADADLGDPQAVAPLRAAIGELALPAMARGVPAAVHQVVRTALWHLDHLIDRPAGQARDDAIPAMVEAFREEWTLQRANWEEISALLLGLGDLAQMRWDALQGRLCTEEWAEARRMGQLLAQAPDLVALIRRLGRGVPRESHALPQPQADGTAPPVAVSWRRTVLPDAPGEVRGIRLGGQLSRMVPSDAAQMMHPVLRKLWRARLAESRLRVWDEEAELLEAVRDPQGRAGGGPRPRPRRGNAAP